MTSAKNDSYRQQMISSLGSMKLGETKVMKIENVDNIRVASYKVGLFSFIRIKGERGMFEVTRRGIEQKSQRAIVREALGKKPMSVVFADMSLGNVRNYVHQYDQEFGTIHRVEPSPKGMVVTRQIAREHCERLTTLLEDPKSSAKDIGAAFAVVYDFCKAEQARRFA